MDSNAQPPKQQRRRGKQLENTLLDAAWAELAEVGLANLTMESIAQRARTGIAVLYRRWSNKDELVLAAIKHYRASHPVILSETGSLRGDLLVALTGMGENLAAFYAISTATAYSGLMARMGLTPSQFRDRIVGDQRQARMRSLFERAHARGEIDIDRLSAAVLALPYDLVRHDLVMYGEAVRPERIAAIIDDVVLPLVLVGRPS
jgi:AcrR family transcriptional regulator